MDLSLLIAVHSDPPGNLVASVGWKTEAHHAMMLQHRFPIDQELQKGLGRRLYLLMLE